LPEESLELPIPALLQEAKFPQKEAFIHQTGNHSMFIMTPGLRSVWDKAIAYF
jgi:hypothetical protein